MNQGWCVVMVVVGVFLCVAGYWVGQWWKSNEYERWTRRWREGRVKFEVPPAVRIERWRVVPVAGRTPEETVAGAWILVGEIFDSGGQLPDGCPVATPALSGEWGRVAVTLEIHPHWIVLGEPDPDYVSQVATFNPAQPLAHLPWPVQHFPTLEALLRGEPAPAGLNELLAKVSA